MADLVQDTRLQFKRATSEYWVTQNPILLEGEPGYITDLKKYKIGDGQTAWNDLPYEDDAGHNFILNGGFDLWQRGSTFSSDPTSPYAMTQPDSFTADRWQAIWTPTSTGIFSVTRQALDPEVMHEVSPASESGYEGQYFLRLDVTLGDPAEDDTHYRILRQPIEDVRTLSNQYVTVSFYARADADSDPDNNESREVQFSLAQHFGDGAAPSATEETNRATASLTTEWQRFSETFFVPSIKDSSIGTSSSIYLSLFMPVINYDRSSGQGYTIDIWGVMVEPSETMSKTFRRSSSTMAGEIDACQRYYQLSDSYLNYGITTTSAGLNFHPIVFPITMRSTPSITFPFVYEYGISSSVAVRSASSTDAGTKQFSIRIMDNPTVVGNRIRFKWTADAEIKRS